MVNKNGIPVMNLPKKKKGTDYDVFYSKLSYHFIQRLKQRMGVTTEEANKFIADAIMWGDLERKGRCLMYNGWHLVTRLHNGSYEFITAYRRRGM